MIHTPDTSSHFWSIIKLQTKTDWIDCSYGNDDCDSISSETYSLQVHFPDFGDHSQFQLSIFDYRTGEEDVKWEYFDSICALVDRVNCIIQERDAAIATGRALTERLDSLRCIVSGLGASLIGKGDASAFLQNVDRLSAICWDIKSAV